MPRLFLLGPLDLTDTDGSARALLAQPRRVGLLAYLALAGRRGPLRRDLLLPLFWPDSDEHHARNNLRSAIHFLRESLSADALVSRGSEELCLDRARVWCDAVAFEDACDSNEYDEALRLYRGGLLPGFYLDGAEGFERWLEEERERLRRRAAAAAWALTDAAEAAGERGLAAHNARRAVGLGEESETAVGRLIELLARTGDRTGAIEVFDRYAERMRREYELEPEPELVGRIEALRKTARTPPVKPVPEPIAAAEFAEQTTAPEPVASLPDSVVSRDTAGVPVRRQGWRRRRTTLLVGLPLMLLATGAVVSRVLPSTEPRGPATAPAGDPDRVAVLPFDYSGAPDLAFLRYGVVTLLASRLDGAGSMKAVDTRALLARLDGGAMSFVDGVESAAALAGEFGAGLWVTGSVVEQQETVRLTAALYSVHAGAAPEVFATVVGSRGDLPALVDELALRIIESRNPYGLGSRAVRSTPVLAAARAFLRGDEAYRRGEWDDATTAFEEAIAADTLFALAYYRLSTSAYAAGRRSMPAAERALELGNRLSPLDSALIAAWRYLLRGEIELAHLWYRRLLERRPTDVEAWWQYGDLVYHWSGVLGLSPSDSRPAFERVLEFEPDHVEAVLHLGRVAARQRDTAVVDSLAQRLRELQAHEDMRLELELIRAWLAEDSAGTHQTIRLLLDRPASTGRGALIVATASTERLDAAAELADTLVERDPLNPDALLRAVEIAAGCGRLSEALALLEQGALVPERVIELRAMLVSLPHSPATRARREASRRALAAVPKEQPPPRSDPIWRGSAEIPPLAWHGIYDARRDYLLGMLAIGLGNEEGFTAALASLEQAGPADGPMDERAARYARILRARQALDAGDARRGLDLLGPPMLPRPTQFETFLDYPRSYERLLRAELLEGVGRFDEALRWYGTFPDPTAHDLPLLVPAHLGRARIFERQGETAAAAAEYRAVARLWRDADPALRAVADRAASRPAGPDDD